MTPESSPFRPGQPAPVRYFVGRSAQVERLRSMVRGSAQGRLGVGFVSGERGIGKSSLARFVRHLAEREHDAVGCHVFLGGVNDLGDALRRTYERLLNESVDKAWHQQLQAFFGDRIRKVGLFGVTFELDLPEHERSAVKHGFVTSVRRLLDSLKPHKKSLLLILDDINGLAGSDEFANWLKSTVDEIATSEQETRLCLLVVGLDARRQELVRRQPSLARVFHLIDMAPWSDDETLEFYRGAFRDGRAEVAEEDLRLLTACAGGLPVIAHETGDAVWRTARTPAIGRSEVLSGIVTAAEVIGSKLLEPRVFKAVRNERYRTILGKLADEPRMRFRRSEIRARLTATERGALDNFLRRMRELGVLEFDPEVQGGYRFPNHLYALYVQMESRRAGS